MRSQYNRIGLSYLSKPMLYNKLLYFPYLALCFDRGFLKEYGKHIKYITIYFVTIGRPGHVAIVAT